MHNADVKVIVVMGVAGSGKSLVGSLLAEKLGWSFADADDFHSASNREKMSAGIPLSDADRDPWLDALKAAIVNWCDSGARHVLACSALREKYRASLRVEGSVLFVYLRADRGLIEQRLQRRTNHFMKSNMLESQFATLEEPKGDDCLTLEAAASPTGIVASVCKALAQSDR